MNNVHKKIRNYECDVCKERFFRADTRDNHRARHFDPFLKCLYCDKMFKGELDRRKHELSHTGEKQFFCKLCSHGFTQLWPYYQHMWRIHKIQREEAKDMRIKNPNLVFMRNVNKKITESSNEEKVTLDLLRGRNNVGNQTFGTEQLRKLGNADHTITLEMADNLVFSEVDEAELENTVEEATHLVEYPTESLDLSTNTIVLNMKDECVDGTKETIVIQNFEGGDGYIMFEGKQTDNSSVIIVNNP